MPHLTLEYSSNVKEKKELASLLVKLNHVLAETASAELASCKSRAVEHTVFCVGDGNAKNAFVHAEARLSAGRTMAVREEVAKQLLKVLSEYFADSLKHLKLQITVESTEFSWNLYAKAANN